MLYDFLPPLIFFLSLGSILVIIARILKRVKQAKLSSSLRSAATSDVRRIARKLRPDRAHVLLFSSRLLLVRRWLGEAGRLLGVGWRYLQHAGARVRQAWPKRRALPEPQPVVVSASKQAPAPTPVATVTITPPAPKQKKPPKVVVSKKVTTPAFFKKAEVLPQLQQARQAFEAAHYKQVEDILVPYIFKHTNDTAAYMLLGKAALRRENWAEAVEIFEQVIVRKPSEEGVYADLGLAAYRAGRFAKALQALQRAHEYEPGNEQVLEYLLEIARKMDNRGLQGSIQAKLEALSMRVAARAGR